RGECAARPLSAAQAARAVRRRASSGDRSNRLDARRSATRTLRRTAPRRSGGGRARTRRAGAALPQSPRLRAAYAVSELRLPLRVPELRRVAGRSPLQAAARLPSLRILDAAAPGLSEMPGDRKPGGGRPRRRAAAAGGGRAVPG